MHPFNLYRLGILLALLWSSPVYVEPGEPQAKSIVSWSERSSAPQVRVRRRTVVLKMTAIRTPILRRP